MCRMLIRINRASLVEGNQTVCPDRIKPKYPVQSYRLKQSHVVSQSGIGIHLVCCIQHTALMINTVGNNIMIKQYIALYAM